jgi:hypothetical protein
MDGQRPQAQAFGFQQFRHFKVVRHNGQVIHGSFRLQIVQSDSSQTTFKLELETDGNDTAGRQQNDI